SGAPDFRLLEVSNSGDLTLQDTTLSGGKAVVNAYDFDYAGGGILNYGGSVTLTNSTVSGNSAAGDGGGIFAATDYDSRGSDVTLTDSTVSGNSAAARFGGGIIAFNNLPPSYNNDVTLSRSLVSGDTAPAAAEVYIASAHSSVTDTFNLLGHNGLTTAQAISGF